MMTWDHLLERFEFAHRRVMNGRKHVRRQRETIAKLQTEGASTAEAKRQLDRFETILKTVEEQYKSIKQGLDARLSK